VAGRVGLDIIGYVEEV